jgi:hypothetical protein
MTLYVPIQRLNGRDDYYRLSCIFHKLGIDADYCQGGWDDHVVGTVVPHLRFKDDEDATVFALHTGCKVYKIPPIKCVEEGE